jgi:N-acetyl-gamma-glutamylphosphate reductase
MNAPAAGHTRLVIVGATGMVGGYAIRYSLNHPAVGRVTAIGRRKFGISHPKLDVPLLDDVFNTRFDQFPSRFLFDRKRTVLVDGEKAWAAMRFARIMLIAFSLVS